MNYTIIGGGITAASALKAIRTYDRESPAIVVSEEKHCFYYRPMTHLVVKGDRERDDLLHDHSDLGNVHMIHDRAVSLDAENHAIALQGGETLRYDRLLIATGSSPTIPNIPGIQEANLYFLRTIDDAEHLREACKTARSAIILGAGLVGIKKAMALAHHNVQVTVIEKEPQILLPRLDKQGAVIVAEKLVERGIVLMTGESVTEITDNGKGVKLASGRELKADFVCLATGVKPNIGWLAGSGVSCEQAIVVDEKQQTNMDHIYAAGDVVQTKDLVSGKTIVSALWTTAAEMGRVAGVNMAGGKLKYPGSLSNLNATEIEGIPFVSIGDVLAEENDGCTVHRWQHKDRYRKLVLQDDVLIGALFMGEINNAGIYTSLIKSGKPLGRLKDKLIQEPISYVDFFKIH